MYKVFINDKPIIILDSNDHYAVQKGTLITPLPEKLQLNSFLELVLNVEACTEWVIIGNDSEKVWRDFCSFFRIINGAGGLVRNKKNELLVIRRNDKWDLPKGKVEKGEALEKAAVREVEEECGIHSLNLTDTAPVTYHIYSQNNNHYLKITHWYYMSYTGKELPVPQISEGIVEARWMNDTEIKAELFANTYANIKNVISHKRISQ